MQKIWGEKPYRSLDWQLKTQFGEKVYKLALNGGMSCPNRDGKVGRGGCIFCSEGGSGDFAADGHLSVTEQIAFQKESLRKKKPARWMKYWPNLKKKRPSDDESRVYRYDAELGAAAG